MIDKLKFDMPFSQDKLIDCIGGLNSIGFKDKITHAYNVTASKPGICYGLSNLMLCCAHSGVQNDLLKQLNKSVDIVSSQSVSDNLIDLYYNKSLRHYHHALLNNLSLPALNTQVNHNMSILVKNILIDMKLEPPALGESDIQCVHRNLINIAMGYSRDDIKLHLGFLSKITDDIYIQSIGVNNKNNDYISIAKNILDNKYMDKTKKIKKLIWNAFNCYRESVMSNMILLNHINGLSTYNGQCEGKMIKLGLQLNQIKLSSLCIYLENRESQGIKKPFYLIMSNGNHAMTLVVNYDTINKCYSYEFFNPNDGIKKVNKLSHFIEFLHEHNKIVEFKKVGDDPSDFMLGYIEYTPIRENNKKINIKKVDHNDVFTTTKKYLSEDKVEIKLLDEWKLKFDDYNVEKNKIKLKLYNGKKKKTIYSKMNDVRELVDIIRDNVDNITKKSGDIIIQPNKKIEHKLNILLNLNSVKQKKQPTLFIKHLN